MIDPVAMGSQNISPIFKKTPNSISINMLCFLIVQIVWEKVFSLILCLLTKYRVFHGLLLPSKMNMIAKVWSHFQAAQDITTINSFSLCITVHWCIGVNCLHRGAWKSVSIITVALSFFHFPFCIIFSYALQFTIVYLLVW